MSQPPWREGDIEARGVHVVPLLMRVVRAAAFVPLGPAYDPRALLLSPIRALRGGADGLAAGFAWVAPSSLRISILARGECSADVDPTTFLAIIDGHPVLEELGRRYDARVGKTPTLFESLARAIVEQLVTTWESRRSVGGALSRRRSSGLLRARKFPAPAFMRMRCVETPSSA